MKSLSNNNAYLRIVTPSIVLIIVNVLLFLFLINYPYFIVIPIIVSAYYIKNIYYKTYNLFYNNEYLLLISKNNQRKVNLKNIKEIKLTQNDLKLFGLQYFGYQISFTNENAINETIPFYISNLKSELWKFQDLLQKINEKVIIENSVKN